MLGPAQTKLVFLYLVDTLWVPVLLGLINLISKVYQIFVHFCFPTISTELIWKIVQLLLNSILDIYFNNFTQNVMFCSNTSLAAPGALTHRLQRCKIRNGCQWAPKWLTWSGNVSNPRFLGITSNFR